MSNTIELTACPFCKSVVTHIVYNGPTAEHENDYGYRGGGGYVKLQASDVLARLRENAERILRFVSRSALPPAPQQELSSSQVSYEPGMGWKLSDEARDEIERIQRQNVQNAAKHGNTILGSSQVSQSADAAEESDIPCERCQGNGEIVTNWELYKAGTDDENAVTECPDCNGTGRVGPDAAAETRPLTETAEHLAFRDDIERLIKKHEGNGNHDAGAFDRECEICRIMEDFRCAVSSDYDRYDQVAAPQQGGE